MRVIMNLKNCQWIFFPCGTERRFHIKKENIQQILELLKLSFRTTRQQFQIT